MRFPDPRAKARPAQPKVTTYEQERNEAASARILASMELKLHGVPKKREARQRLEAVLGPQQAPDVISDYDELRLSGYDALRHGR